MCVINEKSLCVYITQCVCVCVCVAVFLLEGEN